MNLKDKSYGVAKKGVDLVLNLIASVVSSPIQAALDSVLPRIVDILCDVALIPLLRAFTGLIKNIPVIGPSLVRGLDYLFEKVSEIFPVDADRYLEEFLASEESTNVTSMS